ncbi:hypothetical protein GGI07_001180 [Coemansia sp. Benny D115]|nr:hypothetical protein GGI07_001180 [Coemansia sp. Benny D115]
MPPTKRKQPESSVTTAPPARPVAVATPAHKRRTQAWTEAEKELVFEKLQNGRAPITEITQHLGGTKSLRQVAEYLEYLHFWSTLLHDPKDPLPEPPEAICDDPLDPVDEQIQENKLQEEARADDFNTKIEAFRRNKLLTQRNKRLSEEGRKYLMFDSEFGDLLAQMVTGSDDAKVPPDTFILLYEILHEFVSRVMREAFAAYTVRRVNKNAPELGAVAILSAESINDVLRKYGYSQGKPPGELMNELVSRYALMPDDGTGASGEPSEAGEPNDPNDSSSNPDRSNSDPDESSESGQPSEQDGPNNDSNESGSDPDEPSQADNADEMEPREHNQPVVEAEEGAYCTLGDDVFVVHNDPVYDNDEDSHCTTPPFSESASSDEE